MSLSAPDEFLSWTATVLVWNVTVVKLPDTATLLNCCVMPL